MVDLNVYRIRIGTFQNKSLNTKSRRTLFQSKISSHQHSVGRGSRLRTLVLLWVMTAAVVVCIPLLHQERDSAVDETLHPAVRTNREQLNQVADPLVSCLWKVYHSIISGYRNGWLSLKPSAVSCDSVIHSYANGWMTLPPSAVSCDSVLDNYTNVRMTLPPSAVSYDSVVDNYTNRWMTLPPSPVSCDSVVDNYTNRWMTLPQSAVSCDSVVDNYTNRWMTLPPSPVSCDSVVDNYTNRWMTLPQSAVSCDSVVDNYTNRWMTLPPSPVSCDSVVDNYTNRWMTLPQSAVSCDSVVDNYTNRWMTLPPSAVSCDSVVDNYTNRRMTLPPSAVSCDSVLDNYTNVRMTLPPTAVSCDSVIDNYTNRWMTLPPSSLSYDSAIDNYTNRWVTLPPSAVSCDSAIDNYTNRWMTQPPSAVSCDSIVDNYTNRWMTLPQSAASCDSIIDNYTNRWMTLPPSAVSCDSVIDNYTNRWMTLPPSAASCDSIVDNYTNGWMTLPPSAVSCDFVIDNYTNRWMTLPPSAVSCDSVVDNYTNGWVTLPPSAVSCDFVIDNYTNRWMTLPPSAASCDSVVDNYINECMTLPPSAENDICPVTENQSQRTCSYLIGNSGLHAYNGNPPMHGGEEDVHELHCEMIVKLSDLVYPGMGSFWEKFVFMLKVYLTPEEISVANNIFKVCETLELKGRIKHGEYGVLKKIFASAGLMKCFEIVEEYSQKIEGTRRKALPLSAAETVVSQDMAEIMYSRDAANTVCSQDTAETVNSRGTAETVYSRDTAETVYSRDTAETVYSRDTAASSHNNMQAVSRKRSRETSPQQGSSSEKRLRETQSSEVPILEASPQLQTNSSHDLPIELNVVSESPPSDDKNHIYDAIMGFLLSVLDRNLTESETSKEMLTRFDEWLLRYNSVRAERKCLMIYVTCGSRKALNELWQMYQSGELLEILQNRLITRDLLAKCRMESIQLGVFISEEHYKRCLRNIADPVTTDHAVTTTRQKAIETEGFKLESGRADTDTEVKSDIRETVEKLDIGVTEDIKPDILETEENPDIMETEEKKDIKVTEDIKPDILETEENPDIMETEEKKDIKVTEDIKPDSMETEENPDIMETEENPDIMETEISDTRDTDNIQQDIVGIETKQDTRECSMDTPLFKDSAVDVTETGQDFKEWVPPTAGIDQQLNVKREESKPLQENLMDVLAQHAAKFADPVTTDHAVTTTRQKAIETEGFKLESGRADTDTEVKSDIRETVEKLDIGVTEDIKPDILETEENPHIMETEEKKDIKVTEDIKPDILETEENPDIMETEEKKDIKVTEDIKPDSMETEENPDIMETEENPDIMETEISDTRDTDNIQQDIVGIETKQDTRECSMDTPLFKDSAVDVTETGQDFKEWVPPTAGIDQQLNVKREESKPLQENLMDVLAQHAAKFGAAETVYSRDTAASSHKMPSAGKVALVHQNIGLVYGNLELEEVDVIVCEVDNSLNPAAFGSVAKSLFAVGGKTLMAECKSKFPNGIKHGQVVAINSGNLKCKKLYLFTLPVVQHHQTKKEKNQLIDLKKLLRTTIAHIKSNAVEDSVMSLAIPAIGTSTIHISTDDLANIMLKTFRECERLDVKIVLHDKRTMHTFLHAAKTIPSVDMEASVKVWGNNDKLCYETKGIKDVVQKICSDEHSYICVVGEPGCGKSTAIRHAALHLKDKFGYIIYPVSGPEQFIDYLDPGKPQVGVIDDIIGEYFIDQDKIKLWDKYNKRIKDWLQVHKNTKVLFSLRVQLHSELKSKGNAHIYNDQCHVINFSDKEYKLSRDTMEDMLRHYLQVQHVQNIEDLIRRVWWGEAEQFAGCFPLLCKVFSEDESVRVDPEKYFSHPWPALQNIFKQIKSKNKHQFCGLLLCGITDLKDEYFSPLSELNKPKHFNLLIKSQKLDPDTDLDDIKQALNNLDGVYISHIGNRYTFVHSFFQNMVTFLYDDKYYVLKYATLDFIHTRVRLFSKFDTDDDYVKVFYGDDCVELLVHRMIEELRSDDRVRWSEGVRFIVYSHYIDNKELITCLMEKLFDSKHTQITQDKIDELFGECLYTVCIYKPLPPHTNVTSCPQYQLFLSLITRRDCNKQIEWLLWGYPLLVSVYRGSLPVTKALVEHQADVNVVDSRHKRCVLHWAVDCRQNNVDMTKYLLSLPNLKCLNHRDSDGHTPYWYVVNNKLWSWPDDVPHRDELMKLYKHKAAICE